jgi:hypothetical protein
MRDGVMRVQEKVQALVQALETQDVVCKTTTAGEPLLELYSLLDALAPDEREVAERLRRVRFVLMQQEELGLYLVYIPLSDVLVYLVPCSTLPEARAFQRWVSKTLLPAMRKEGANGRVLPHHQRSTLEAGDPRTLPDPAHAFLHELYTALEVTF